jgi:cytochrome b pre-mRNA-processing protein 3
MTQKLFEACSSQADYKIPQASQKGTEVPKTEAGEDLGVGEGWWYKGKRSLAVSGLGYDLV